MTKYILAFFLFSHCASAQQDLYQHVFWQAWGTRSGYRWGYTGLDTVGRLNDSIHMALAIAESGTNGEDDALCFNRGKVDTLRHKEFSGSTLLTGNFNNDAYKDLVVMRSDDHTEILFGTPVLDSFTTALVLQGHSDSLAWGRQNFCIADADSDGFDDFITSERYFTDSTGINVGRLMYWHGGIDLDSTPLETLLGQGHDPNKTEFVSYVGGTITTGSPRGDGHRYLIELRLYGHNAGGGSYQSAKIFLYPFGPDFHLQPTDSILCTFDPTKFGSFSGEYEFNILDIDGDGIDDICLATYNGAVLIYKGGKTTDSLPTYILHRPYTNGSTAFGTKIIDVGDFCGHGYHSVLITDPQAYLNQVGEVFLYNIGAALKDSCVAHAVGPYGSDDYFGTQVVAPGDLTGDGRSEIIVGSQSDNHASIFLDQPGYVVVFQGDSSYGPSLTSVQPIAMLPTGIELAQNTPNPVRSKTEIAFRIATEQMYGSSIDLRLYDLQGRDLGLLYQGIADGSMMRVTFDLSLFPPGAYLYRLRCGTRQLTKLLTIVH